MTHPALFYQERIMSELCVHRYMTDSAAGILELCVAQPSDLRSRIGAALIDALPPCRAALADLLPARLQAQGGCHISMYLTVLLEHS